MKHGFPSKTTGLAGFLVITALVAGGLGWVSTAALNLEREQLQARAENDQDQKLRLALWKLDSRIAPILAREDSRPYSHYPAVFAPSLALRNNGAPYPPGTVLELSPLLNADLPDWILLHFQTDEEANWSSPEVLPPALARRLEPDRIKTPLKNLTPRRKEVLADLARLCPPPTLLASVQQRGLQLNQAEIALVPAHGAPERPTQQNAMNANQSPFQGQDYQSRLEQQSKVMNESKLANPVADDPALVLGNLQSNGLNWFSPNQVRPTRGEQVAVNLSPMVPLWLRTTDGQEWLLAARLVQIGSQQVCQGMVLDWPRLLTLLGDEIHSLFPEARLEPVLDRVPPRPERTMTALPVELNPGPFDPLATPPGWTPLRVGLACAWAAALVALLAVGLGGWSLLSLSERRIRFVSAVTHELRTPLTTLRLYLDMLATGMVREEQQRAEYLHTLNAEADRLHRLIANVLHFSRLEKQRPHLQQAAFSLEQLLDQVRATWEGRCQDAGKELVLENTAGAVDLRTDLDLVQQILGNLIDNACKYSRGAEDRRIWVQARWGEGSRLVLEVKDRGPGIAKGEGRAIFRPFRRGRGADVTAGGVGLGLALAQRWTRLLGGRLTLHPNSPGLGACFRFEFPPT